MVSEREWSSLEISDAELSQVSGGISVIRNRRGEEMKEGRFITSTMSSYAGGGLPRFSVGQNVKIRWYVSAELSTFCNAEVIAVSAEKSGGLLFRKYTYAVRILDCPNSDLTGTVENSVQENCLYAN